MTYNRRMIMLEAWETVRRLQRRGDKRTVFQLLGHALRSAWYSAKVALRIARQSQQHLKADADLEARSVASLQAEVTNLENKTFLRHDGMERVSQLRRALSVARARETQALPIAA